MVAAVALLAGTTAPLSAVAATPAANGVAAWGSNILGEGNVPAGLTDVTAVGAGLYHGLAVRSDGTVAAWGDNGFGQATVPAGLTDVIAVAGGFRHSIALRSDGTVTAWGANYAGQTTVPAGLTDVVAIDAGIDHSLAVRGDGTVAAWGANDRGQTAVPAGLTDVAAVAGGSKHSLALRSDGTVTAWGSNDLGQTAPPSGLTGVTAIAAGNNYNLALRSDGTVVAWGDNSRGQAAVPAGLTDVTAVSAGIEHSLALRSDGTVVAWGQNNLGQATVPVGLTGATAISAGGLFNLAVGPRPVFTADTPPTTATIDTPYSYAFGATGASTFEVGSGALPSGLTLSPNGGLSGTPTTSGTYDFTITARNAFGATIGTTCTVVVDPVAPRISGTVAAGVVDSAYDYTYTVTGAPAPTVTVTSGTLPPGLALDSTGRLTGTPTRAGTYTFTVRAANSAGSATAQSTLTISPKAVSTKADLRVDIAASTTAVKGKQYTYTVTTKNAGPATSNTVYTKVILPLNMQFVSATGKYTRIGNIVIFQRSSLTSGQSVSEEITVKATGTGKGTALAATFSVRTPDPLIRSNADTAATTVR